MGWLLLFVILFLIHGSLYPYHFQQQPLPFGPLQFLWDTWPHPVGAGERIDALANVIVYIPLGWFAEQWLRRRLPQFLAAGVALLIGGALSTSMEILQIYDARRVASLLDVFTNLLGTLLGVGLAWALPYRGASRPGWRDWRPHDPFALLLVALWTGAQLAPFAPIVSRGHVLRGLTATLHVNQADPLTWSTRVGEALLLAWLTQAAAGGANVTLWLALLLFTYPLQWAVAERASEPGALVATALGFALWQGWLSRWRGARPLLAAGLLALTILSGLRPFHWQAATQPFEWTPFSGLLESDHWRGLGVLLQKSFVYGGMVWALAEQSRAVWQAGISLAVLLAGVEFAQRHLPGRVPEITDPLLALAALGLLLIVRKDHDRQAVKEPEAAAHRA